MTVTMMLAVVAATWLTIGLALAVTMRRHGHDAWMWLMLGTILGPLAVPLAVERARYHPKTDPVRDDTLPDGSLDVLVGVDGSSQALAALRRALDLLGDRVTSVTVVTVLDRDAAHAGDGSAARVEADEILTSASHAAGITPVTTEVLFGRPDRALADHATRHGIDLIVVGPRGRGMSEALFGSVTGRLVGRSPVPVLVGSDEFASTAVEFIPEPG